MWASGHPLEHRVHKRNVTSACHSEKMETSAAKDGVHTQGSKSSTVQIVDFFHFLNCAALLRALCG